MWRGVVRNTTGGALRDGQEEASFTRRENQMPFRDVF
jgi:hypothetical protein